jgi:hypothetical protein
MNWLQDLNLIRCFDWYLMLIFLAGTVLRIRQYHSLLALIWLFPGRWPRLLELVKGHREVFLTWRTVLPGMLALLLSLGHMLACRLLWPHADVTFPYLAQRWAAAIAVSLLGAAMVGFDCYSAARVGKWDRDQVQKQLDQAEFWLQSWTAPVLRVLTFGFLHPRRMVSVEIHKVLVAASRQLNLSLWWMSLQVSLRIGFGAALWLTFVAGSR